MTDRTQPDSASTTGSTHIIRYALELGLLWIDGDGRDKVREALDALDDLEAQLEAIGAGGVQALSAVPEAIAKLRHLYQNMVNGAVRDTASAKRIAEGLLAPAIEALERATPPAEQAAPKAAPAKAADSVLEDAARYQWLKSQASEKLLNTRAALSEICPDMRTHWKLPTLICSGPLGGYLDFDAAIDAALAAQGGKA